MLLGCGCLIAIMAGMAPRLVLIFAWIFGRRWDAVWDGNWILPVLGIVFLPYTTVMYILVWSPAGLSIAKATPLIKYVLLINLNPNKIHN